MSGIHSRPQHVFLISLCPPFSEPFHFMLMRAECLY
jgi:hypothetical protein